MSSVSTGAEQQSGNDNAIIQFEKEKIESPIKENDLDCSKYR